MLYRLPWIVGAALKGRRLSLVRRLDPELYERRMPIRSCKGKLVEQFRAAGIGVTEIGNGALFDRRLMARSLRDAWRFQPDIVHGAVFEGVATAVVTRAAQRGRVSWRRGPRTRPTARAATTAFAASSLLSDVCVAIWPKVGDYLAQEAKVPRAKVRVTTNGVAKPEAPALCVAEVRQSFGLPPDVFVAGTVCRLMGDGHKRVSDLLGSPRPVERFARAASALSVRGRGRARA